MIAKREIRRFSRIKKTEAKLAGSIVEGGFSPFYFFPNTKFVDGFPRIFDADAQSNILQYKSDQQECVVALEKPGFVKIKLSRNSVCFCTDCEVGKDIDKDIKTAKGYLLPYKTKKLLSAKNQLSKTLKKINHFVGIFLFDKNYKVADTSSQTVTKATINGDLVLKKENTIISTISVDIAILGQLDWQTNYIKT